MRFESRGTLPIQGPCRCVRQSISRRELLCGLLPMLTAAAVVQPAQAIAADAPLLSPGEPAAKAVKYTENASSAKGVPAGNSCANCALYQGTYGSIQGPCQLFAGKQVKAAGWCSSWSPQM